MSDYEIIKQIMKSFMSRIYKGLIAETLTSVNKINVSNAELLAPQIIPTYYQQILDDINLYKGNIKTIFYDERSNSIKGYIDLKNYETYTTEVEIIKEKYFKQYEQDLKYINIVCNKFNAKSEFKIDRLHSSIMGWSNTINIEIKEKRNKK
jgi:hypothetical protein